MISKEPSRKLTDAVLSEDIYEKMRYAAISAYPHEACGILFGGEGDRGFDDIWIRPNRSAVDPDRPFFSIDPLDFYKAEQEAAREGMEVTGIFHSHPGREALPSPSDAEYMIPGMIYLILSVSGTEARDIRAYLKEEVNGELIDIKVRRER